MSNNMYSEKLLKTVIEKSKGNTWEEAVREWEVRGCDIDHSASTLCTCGKEGLKYLFTLKNIVTGSWLYPIGSSCIKKFNNDEMNHSVKYFEDLYVILKAIEANKHISLSSDLFSRKLLYGMYEDGAFEDSKYNHYDGYNDYKFLLDMFNKKSRGGRITEKQEKKINGLIYFSIRPFLKEKLEKK